METTRSRDYHDYVFRDKRLVGEFEQMYRNSEAIPWHQDQIDRPDVLLIKTLARLKAPYASILDVGCGLGYFANELCDLSGRVAGLDISATAIQQMTKQFPHIQGHVVDLTQESDLSAIGSFELVVCRGFFWYVFPQLERTLLNISNLVADGGYLLLHQNFPDLESNFIGKEVIPNPHRLLKAALQAGPYELLCTNEFRDLGSNGANDDWSSFFLKKSRNATPSGKHTEGAP